MQNINILIRVNNTNHVPEVPQKHIEIVDSKLSSTII